MRKRAGALLSQARARKGLTQEELAQLLGMSRQNLSHMEAGRRKDVLTPEQVQTLVRALHPYLDGPELVKGMGFPVARGALHDDEQDLLLAVQGLEPHQVRAVIAYARAIVEHPALSALS